MSDESRAGEQKISNIVGLFNGDRSFMSGKRKK